jgi:hypothetical protein
MTALTLGLILVYLIGIEKDNHRRIKSRKQSQYEQNVGCYLIDF